MQNNPPETNKKSDRFRPGTLPRSLCIALSMYSRIPVPQIRWDETPMKNALCFLPLIGGVIGGAELCWYLLARHFVLSGWLFAALATAIPVLITGGIHLDGFMDTHDALASYGEPEKRHAILKDPHTGAFAVIHACLYFLLTAAFFAHVYEKGGGRDIAAIAVGYVISRGICACSIVLCKCARDSGLASLFQNGAGKKSVLISQVLILSIAVGAWIWLLPITAFVTLLLIFIVCMHFRVSVLKKFHGITGDLAGYLLTRVELTAALGVVVGMTWNLCIV